MQPSENAVCHHLRPGGLLVLGRNAWKVISTASLYRWGGRDWLDIYTLRCLSNAWEHRPCFGDLPQLQRVLDGLNAERHVKGSVVGCCSRAVRADLQMGHDGSCASLHLVSASVALMLVLVTGSLAQLTPACSFCKQNAAKSCGCLHASQTVCLKFESYC